MPSLLFDGRKIRVARLLPTLATAQSASSLRQSLRIHVSEPLNFLIEMALHTGSPFGVLKAVVCSYIHL